MEAWMRTDTRPVSDRRQITSMFDSKNCLAEEQEKFVICTKEKERLDVVRLNWLQREWWVLVHVFSVTYTCT